MVIPNDIRHNTSTLGQHEAELAPLLAAPWFSTAVVPCLTALSIPAFNNPLALRGSGQSQVERNQRLASEGIEGNKAGAATFWTARP